MTYSCAVWADPSITLDEAQEAKYELICQKLALQPGQRLLDIGCGWGGMAMHAAKHHGVTAVGVTLSTRQGRPLFAVDTRTFWVSRPAVHRSSFPLALVYAPAAGAAALLLLAFALRRRIRVAALRPQLR